MADDSGQGSVSGAIKSLKESRDWAQQGLASSEIGLKQASEEARRHTDQIARFKAKIADIDRALEILAPGQ